VGVEALQMQALVRDVRRKIKGKPTADPDSYSVQLKVYDRAWGEWRCHQRDAAVPVAVSAPAPVV
jgi:hypothetical protein